MSKISAELFPMYLLVKRADILAHSMYRREEELENLSGLQKCYEEIVADHECVSFKTACSDRNGLDRNRYETGKADWRSVK